MSNDSQVLLSINNLSISAGKLELFKNFNLEVSKGQITGLSAPTGTGKTSLFNYIAGLLPETFEVKGEIKRNCSISYVFQEPRLIPSVSVLKNVMLPLENKMDMDAAKKLAATWLEKLNMAQKMNESVKSLSGGEQQRTSIARAFATLAVPEHALAVPEPVEGLLLLDEPFASQDETNINNIISLTKELVEQNKCACLVISHDKANLEKLCDKILYLTDF